jgi:hypothetical protein
LLTQFQTLHCENPLFATRVLQTLISEVARIRIWVLAAPILVTAAAKRLVADLTKTLQGGIPKFYYQ